MLLVANCGGDRISVRPGRYVLSCGYEAVDRGRLRSAGAGAGQRAAAACAVAEDRCIGSRRVEIVLQGRGAVGHQTLRDRPPRGRAGIEGEGPRRAVGACRRDGGRARQRRRGRAVGAKGERRGRQRTCAGHRCGDLEVRRDAR